MLKKLFYVAIFLIAVSVISCGGKKKQETQSASMEQLYAQNGQPVSVRKLVSEDFSIFLKYPTIINASSESTAYATISDVIRIISASVGNVVRQDDVIISLSADNRTLVQANLAFENAANAFNRSSALFRSNDISQHEFEQARMQYEIARTNLKAANDMIYIKAPISGTITQINVRPTENVQVGTPLFTVSNQHGFEARFYVGTDEIDKIQTGARAFINDPSQNLEGRITQVSLVIDTQKQSFPVTAFFNVEDRKLYSGMSVDIVVETYRNETAIILSRNELMRTESGYAAFVAEGNTARQVPVSIGNERGLNYEIISGLSEGDILISEGVQRISADKKINIVPAILTSTKGE